MKRHDLSLTIALCASLAAHALLLRFAADRYAQDLNGAQSKVFPAPNGASKSQSAPPAANEPAVPLQILNSDFGDSEGRGIGSNAVDADGPRRALEGDEEQAQLSRDPARPQVNAQFRAVAPNEGDGGHGGQPAGSPTQPGPISPLSPPPKPGATSVGAVPELVVSRAAPHKPERLIAIQALAGTIANDDEPGAGSTTPPPAESASDDAKAHSIPPTLLADASGSMGPLARPHKPSPAMPEAQPNDGDARMPGSSGKPAQPGLLNESDSDAFSKVGGLEVRNGKLLPKFGRKVKTVKPHLMLSGQLAVFQSTRTVIVRASIDPTGKVTSVDVYKSCGSADVDQPTRAAVYDWWFEPSRDGSGKPIPDVLIFPIVWR